MTLTPYNQFVESMDMSTLALQESVNTVGGELLASWRPAASSKRRMLAGALVGTAVGACLRLAIKKLRE